MWAFLHKLASPKYCYRSLLKLQPWFGWITLLFFSIGLVFSLGIAPSDYQQGEVYRILFLHVPAAVMALLIYCVMTVSVILHWVWKLKIADMVAKISAPIGVFFTLITLISGSLWGKPTWGTYWIWDARLTSELILLFVYLGIIAFRSAIPDQRLAARATGMLTLVGVVNLPIIHYSVQWWNTLHQGATILKLARPSIDSAMLWPLIFMLCAYLFFYGYLLCLCLRQEILLRESSSQWFGDNCLRG